MLVKLKKYFIRQLDEVFKEREKSQDYVGKTKFIKSKYT